MSLYILMMGVQGAGKGTQAGFIQEKYGIPQISTGDLFRAMKTREDDFAKQIQAIMASGQLVSDEITSQVLQERLELPDAANGAIFDGYPRTPAQADWLENYLNQRGAKLNAAFLLELDLYTAFKRAFGRVESSEKPGVFHNIYYNDGNVEYSFDEHPEKAFPPQVNAKHKITGEALKRRPDDANAASVVKRIDTFLETTLPLIEYYEKKNLLIRINADQPVEAVWQELQQALEQVKG
jgi:adenylate kinase